MRRCNAGFTLVRQMIVAAMLFAASVVTSWASVPATLTSLRTIHSLSNTDADRAIPVEFQATVTYFRGYEKTLFVQDGNLAIFVQPDIDVQLTPGDRVLIKGTTKGSFRPIVIASSISVLRHMSVPQPVPATADQLSHAQLDCQLVTVRAVIRAADTVLSSGVSTTYLQMRADGAEIDATVDNDKPDALDKLLDAEVQVTGAVSARFDGKKQQAGNLLHVTSMADVVIVSHAAVRPWSLPVTPISEIFSGNHEGNPSRRVRIHGTVTYYQPGNAAVLQEGSTSLWVMTSSVAPVSIGDVADATGFPEKRNGLPALTSAEIKDSGTPDPILPKHATWEELSAGGNLFDLVSTEGTVVAEIRAAAQDEYILAANGNLFSAVYKHPELPSQEGSALPPLKHMPIGSSVRVTGICVMDGANLFDSRMSFNILLRTADDIGLVARPSLLAVDSLVRLVVILLVTVMGTSLWGWMLRRRVREQTAAITAQVEAEASKEQRIIQLEKWRSQILEDINSSLPLAEILEHITAMVSFTLNGAPCWCEVTDGAKLGTQPTQMQGLRIVEKKISAHAGGALGTILAAFDAAEADAENEATALGTGARLATLAIETRRLYSDLVYRSEFDLLTDVYNRFSLDRFLEEQITKARESASIIGLIYVDLDEFKLVNDQYGHHVGDLYLQEVAVRMRRQLRNSDMLARLGGDEFAALVPVVRSLADVEEIARRLEICFDAPLELEGHLLYGTASVGIALYPADGTTAESLLRAADAAMYVAKQTKRANRNLPDSDLRIDPQFRD